MPMDLKVQAAVKANILGMHMTGMISNANNVKEFLIMPTPAAQNTPMTVTKICAEVNKMIYKWNGGDPAQEPPANEPVNPKMIENAMAVVGLDEAEFGFTQFFIYYKKDGTTDALLEYAIGMYISSTKAPDPSGFAFLDIEEVFINLWNTTNATILEKMKIWTTDQLIPVA